MSPMLTGSPDPSVVIESEEHPDRLVVRTAAVELTVVRDPWRLELRDRSTRALLWATRPVDIEGLRRPRNQWNPPEQRWLFLHRYAYPLGATRGSGSPRAFASFDLRHDVVFT